MRFNKLFVTGAAGVAAIALVGLGAGATFDHTFNVTQHITTGHSHLQTSLTSTGAWADSTPLPDLVNQGSTFDVSKYVYIKNVGSVPATLTGVKLTYGTNSTLLAQDVTVTVGKVGATDLTVPANVAGSASAFNAQNHGTFPVTGSPTLAVNGVEWVKIEFSANNLPTTLQDKYINITLTATASG